MELIKNKWPWLGIPLVAIDVITWFLKQEWSLITKPLIEAYQASLTEVTIPLWIMILAILAPMIFITLWDTWKESKKQKPDNIVLDGIDASVVRHMQEIPENNCVIPADIAAHLSATEKEIRQSFIRLHKYKILDKDEFHPELGQQSYSITDFGMLVE